MDEYELEQLRALAARWEHLADTLVAVERGCRIIEFDDKIGAGEHAILEFVVRVVAALREQAERARGQADSITAAAAAIEAADRLPIG